MPQASWAADSQPSLNWITPEIVRGFVPEWRAETDDGGEYLIRGPLPHDKPIPGTRTFEQYYTVSLSMAVSPTGVAVACERIGEASTLRKAKLIAQRHYVQHCDSSKRGLI